MVFIAQIIGIMSFLIFSKIFTQLVRKCNKKDLKDPFQKLLYNKNVDFLETDNFFLSIYVIQIMNIALGFMVSGSNKRDQ